MSPSDREDSSQLLRRVNEFQELINLYRYEHLTSKDREALGLLLDDLIRLERAAMGRQRTRSHGEVGPEHS